MPDIARLFRSGMLESHHQGDAVLVDRRGVVIWSLGDPSLEIWTRSAVKPLQALPFAALNLLDELQLTPEHLAIVGASHSGEKRHRDLVLDILQAVEMTESDLACGYHRPYDGESAREMIRLGLPPGPLYHNCSGKHAGMLALNRRLGGSKGSYLDPDSPGQQFIRTVVDAFAGTPSTGGVDGCNAPSFRMPLLSLARSFAVLVSKELPPGLPQGDLPWGRGRSAVVDCYTEFPELVGGARRRFETDLMKNTGGDVLAKSGGEGVEVLGFRELGWGLAIKVRDGASRPIPPWCCRVLERLEVLSDKSSQGLAKWREASEINSAGIRTGALEILPEALPPPNLRDRYQV